MTLAILCSGQGCQHAGMFALTGTSPAAAGLFAQAALVLGIDPRAWVRSADPAELHDNRNAQVICVLQGLAAAAMLAELLPRQRCVAGYSVGEVTAWGVAGLITSRAALMLSAARAAAMNAARRGDQGMLFVRGLSRPVIDELLTARDAAVAIVNPGEAFVLAGSRAALEVIAADVERLHPKRIAAVGVQVASHTRRMAAASSMFREELAQVSVEGAPANGTRLFSGIDAAVVLNGPRSLDKLALQLSQTVQWAACLEACVEAGADAFLELGPGRALTEMATGAYPGLAARSMDDFKSIAGVRAWLARRT